MGGSGADVLAKKKNNIVDNHFEDTSSDEDIETLEDEGEGLSPSQSQTANDERARAAEVLRSNSSFVDMGEKITTRRMMD